MDRRASSSSKRENLSAKAIFDAFQGKTEKRFGQNFLFDEKISRKIVSAAGNLEGKTVLEVGPGPGGLTLEILRQNVKKLFLLEFDRHWADVWRNLRHIFGDKLEIIECDALKFDLETVAPNIIISNLPYNISTKLICGWFPKFHLHERLILTFQKEVAARFCASPCTKAYGRLSVLAQWKSEVSKMFDLEPGSFFPAPKVKSTVLKFVPFKLDQCPCAEKYSQFDDLLALLFTHRRKVVVKSLGALLANPEEALKTLGHDKNTRAEEISIANYLKILEKICHGKAVWLMAGWTHHSLAQILPQNFS
ncbi:MAG: 16S rRNA (adenine(1518)-N(6)/adenine(1519)-N(6))-dimethyltransferase RsmA [Holosporaceae bacterium]|jgi:16S rRNA (adenine1518-N6/adenine1519-N6)-dimethyltransferase|nr:16S rRNA (adenine(1518)-N(6)/adenine(1519)-N(6))-dimethyltransferase RsmA [Holosporaceae bacterium]